MPVPLAQEILLFGVILHQLGQRGKLLAAVQVVVVTRVLDLNVGHLIVPPEQEKPQREFNLSVSRQACKLRWTHSKEALSIFCTFLFSLAPCTTHKQPPTHIFIQYMLAQTKSKPCTLCRPHSLTKPKCTHTIKCPAYKAICSHFNTLNLILLKNVHISSSVIFSYTVFCL